MGSLRLKTNAHPVIGYRPSAHDRPPTSTANKAYLCDPPAGHWPLGVVSGSALIRYTYPFTPSLSALLPSVSSWSPPQVLVEALAHCKREVQTIQIGDGDVGKVLQRLVQIWDNRKLFSPQYTKRLHDSLRDGGALAKALAPAPYVPQTLPGGDDSGYDPKQIPPKTQNSVNDILTAAAPASYACLLPVPGTTSYPAFHPLEQSCDDEVFLLFFTNDTGRKPSGQAVSRQPPAVNRQPFFFITHRLR